TSSPVKSASSSAWTSTSPSPHGSFRPAERREAYTRSSSTGNFRSRRSARVICPVAPVAPTTPIRKPMRVTTLQVFLRVLGAHHDLFGEPEALMNGAHGLLHLLLADDARDADR